MITSLESILKGMQKLSHPALGLLNSGLKEVHIREAASLFKIDLPDSVVAMYQWRNGTNLHSTGTDKVLRMGNVCFFPGYLFFSLEDAISTWNAFSKKNDWNKLWFPIFGSSAGAMYVVNCDRGSLDYGRILEYGDVYFEADILFYSLPKMLETISRAYEVGVFYNGEMGLQSDDQIYLALARDMNAEVPYWQTINAED